MNKLMALLAVICVVCVALGQVDARSTGGPLDKNVEDASCKFGLAQTVPAGLSLAPLPRGSMELERTHEALIRMINGAQRVLRIASPNVELTPQQDELASHRAVRAGVEVRQAIQAAGQRGVSVEIVLDGSNERSNSNQADLDYLRSVADIKFLNMTQLTAGGAFLNTKFAIVDNSSFYLGSAALDWRAYNQSKEMGLLGHDCPVLSRDLNRIFDIYSLMSARQVIPNTLRQFGKGIKTQINMEMPLYADKHGVFLAGSPPAFNGYLHETERTDDIEALLMAIRYAKRQIDVSVSHYSPRLELDFHKYYSPQIEQALREAVLSRHLKVRMLFSHSGQSDPLESVWYKSLNAIQSEALNGSIHVKLFEVPASEGQAEFSQEARIKHENYMVTDGLLYLGTSDWSPSYFESTVGVSAVLGPAEDEARSPLIRTMRNVFERDFNSQYAHELS